MVGWRGGRRGSLSEEGEAEGGRRGALLSSGAAVRALPGADGLQHASFSLFQHVFLCGREKNKGDYLLHHSINSQFSATSWVTSVGSDLKISPALCF